MSINLHQSNGFGENNAHISNSGNEVSISNKTVLKYREQGFFAGVLVSVVAGLILKLIEWLWI